MVIWGRWRGGFGIGIEIFGVGFLVWVRGLVVDVGA